MNQPIGESPDRVLRGRLHEAIPQLRAWFADPASLYGAYSLVWLLHLVADLHQPLHVSTRQLPGGGHDAGGNEVDVLIDAALLPHRRRDRSPKLHACWDELVAPPWLAGEQLARLRDRPVHEHPRRGGPVDPAAWRAQSFALAVDAYRGLKASGRPTRISADAHRQNQRIAERQVTLAGYRLADLLGAALAAAENSAESGTDRQRMAGDKILRRQPAAASALQ